MKMRLSLLKNNMERMNVKIKFIKVFIVLLLMFFDTILFSCKNDFVVYKNENNKNRHIIIDTDTGADDSSAIILAAKDKDIDILGVTTLVGNVELEQSAKNALMSLEMAEREIPVYMGSKKNLNGEDKVAFSVFGNDGMGDKDLIHPKTNAQEKNAIDFIIESAKKYPNELEIISLGPVTNIALAIRKDPEVMKNVKMIWSMGTTGFGHGNASPVAEFNVYTDALAYKEMIESNIPITIVGYDVCGGEAMWTNENFDMLREFNNIGRFVTSAHSVIREMYKKELELDTVENCDSLTVMCALYPDIIKETKQCKASCIIAEGETYGQVIFYKKGQNYPMMKDKGTYNVRLVTAVDGKNFFKNYLHMIK